MIASGTSLTMTRGDSESISVSLSDYSFVEGDIIEFTVRKKVTSSDTSIYKKITTFEDGKAYIDINPEDTSELEFGKYVYDIQWTSSGGQVKTIVKPSTFTLTEEVTHG